MADDFVPNPDTDPFKPPTISTLVSCLHCGEEYDSYLIEWRLETSGDGKEMGFWCCPTPNCDGKGFGLDIFPLDSDYVDEDGNKMWTEDAEGDDDEFDEFDDDDTPTNKKDDGDDEAIPF